MPLPTDPSVIYVAPHVGEFMQTKTTAEAREALELGTAAIADASQFADKDDPRFNILDRANYVYWPEIINKPQTFAPIIGPAYNQAVAGNDARLNDTRDPKTHLHVFNSIQKSSSDTTTLTKVITDIDTNITTVAGVTGEIINGTKVAGVAKDYYSTGAIKSKFDDIDAALPGVIKGPAADKLNLSIAVAKGKIYVDADTDGGKSWMLKSGAASCTPISQWVQIGDSAIVVGDVSDFGLTTKTQSAITSDVTIGAIKAGDVIPINTTYESLVSLMFSQVFNPTYVNPSLSLSATTSVEIGANFPSITANFYKGRINGKMVNSAWDPSAFQNDRSGEPDVYTIGAYSGAGNSHTPSGSIVSGPNSVSASVTYAEGPIPHNNRGPLNASERLSAGTITDASISITGKRHLFYGTVAGALTLNSTTIRDLAFATPTPRGNKILGPAKGNQFNISIATGSNHVIIAYPESLSTVPSPFLIRYVELSNTDVTLNFELVSNSLVVEGASGEAGVAYKIFVYTPNEAFSAPANYAVTL